MTTLTDAALDLQLDMLRWSETDNGIDYIASLYSEDAPARGLLSEDNAVRAGLLINHMILIGGETFAVTDEIANVLEYAADSIPAYPLHDSDMPSHSGFVVFERPVTVRDSFGKPMSVKAIGWASVINGGSGQITMLAEAPAGADTGIAAMLWTDPTNPADHLHDEYLEEHLAEKLAARHMLPPHGYLAACGGLWQHGALPEEDGDVLRLLRAFFRFIQEPWVDPRLTVPSRAARKRALRRKVEPQVHVVQLRRKAGGPHGAAVGTGTVEWSHRWLVRGFWRMQPCGPGRMLRRPTWVREHIKGPENKPLVIHDTIFDVSR